jgi:AcrR family transcriptional regulator
LPTGVAIEDARRRLFDAAERVAVREGSTGLTSRAVTTEARCAKGVLHRHFADFDTFLAELVADLAGRVVEESVTLCARAGSGTVVDNLADALTWLFGSVALVITGLVISRDDLRARLRRSTPSGVPLLAEATTLLGDYLAAEQALGRVAAGTAVDTVALTLIGSGHLLFAGRDSAPEREAVRAVVTGVVSGIVTIRAGDPAVAR